MQNYHEIRRDQPGTYEIQVQGRVSGRWAHWFEDIHVHAQTEPGQTAHTTLTGRVADQAALMGLLQKLYTLGLPLLQVRRKE